MNLRNAEYDLWRAMKLDIRGPEAELQRAIAQALLEVLRRSGWKKIVTDADMPDFRQHCLIWLKGAEHATVATCNVDYRKVKYFILANSGIAKRAMEEVTHWAPLMQGPNDDAGPSPELATLRRALEESIKLQSHYAGLLNDHDGGKRMTFDVDSWLARLEETRR